MLSLMILEDGSAFKTKEVLSIVRVDDETFAVHLAHRGKQFSVENHCGSREDCDRQMRAAHVVWSGSLMFPGPLKAPERAVAPVAESIPEEPPRGDIDRGRINAVDRLTIARAVVEFGPIYMKRKLRPGSKYDVTRRVQASLQKAGLTDMGQVLDYIYNSGPLSEIRGIGGPTGAAAADWVFTVYKRGAGADASHLEKHAKA